jgi:dihydroxyacetone kinase
LGIHNEPGFTTVSPIPPRRQLIEQLIGLLTSTNDTDRSFVPFTGNGDDEVVLMVNNLGGLSELELSGIVREATAILASRLVIVQRVLVGAFMVSII